MGVQCVRLQVDTEREKHVFHVGEMLVSTVAYLGVYRASGNSILTSSTSKLS
jgi:hypothetical protein